MVTVTKLPTSSTLAQRAMFLGVRAVVTVVAVPVKTWGGRGG